MIPPLAPLCALLGAEIDLIDAGRDAQLRSVELRRAMEVDRAAVALGLPHGASLADLVRAAPSPWSQCISALGMELRAVCRRRGAAPPLSLTEFLAEPVGA